MNSLTLDATDPEIRDACADCKVGESRSFEVTGKLTRKSETQYVFDLTDVTYESSGDSSDDAEAAPAKPPYEDASKPAMPAAVSALMH